ncbi:MAG: GC-type dockerin domain-anchored protein [Phycisphaerales bacterium JB058]
MKKNHKLSAAATLLSALAATNAMGQVSNWATAVNGNWNDMARWDNSIVPSAPGQTAVLGLGSAYSVTLDLNVDLGSITVSNPLAGLTVPPGRTLGLNGPTSTNNGIIEFNPNASATNATLSINGNTSIGGSGEIRMRSNSDNAHITGSGILTNGASHTIRGVGRISSEVTNNGEIRADAGVSVSGADLDIFGNITNNGLLSSAGSSALEFVGVTIDQTGGGMIFAENGGFVNVTSTDATILGGTFDSAGTGDINVHGSGVATLVSVTNNGFFELLPGGVVSVDGTGLTNNGTIVLNQFASATNSTISYLTSGSLDGTGEVRMRSNVDNSEILTGVGVTITHGASHTIRGVGQIEASMVNNGTISADASVSVSGNDLDLLTNDKVNNGSFTAEAGSFFDIRGIAIDQLGGGSMIANGGFFRIDDCSIDGGVFNANSGGYIENVAGSISLLSGMTLNGPLTVKLGSAVQVDADGMVNNSTIQLNPDASASNSTLEFTESATLGGSGEVRMRTSADNSQINTVDDAVLTLASTQLVRGVGQVNATLINEGEVRADSSVSVSGNDLDLRTNNMVNNNLFVAAPSSFLDIIGITVDQSGGGMLVADEGVVTIDDSTIEGGTFMAIGAGYLENIVGSTSMLSGVTLNGPSRIRLASTVLVDADGLTNNGIMQMNLNASASDTFLAFSDTSTLDGSGEIHMKTAGNNTQINTDPTFVVTHGADHTIRGVGEINAAMTNNGTISADSSVSVSGNRLELQGENKTNAGVISVESSSFMDITGITLTQVGAGKLQANNGQFNFDGGATLDGGSIEATGTGNFVVNGSATFNGVTVNAPGEVRLASTLNVSSANLENNALLRVNTNQSASDGVIAFASDGAFTTSGAGEIRLEGFNLDAQITGAGTVTNASGHTISGRGAITAPLINQGNINPGIDGIGTLNATSGVTLDPTSMLNIQLGTNNSSDRLAVTGTANLGGTLNVAMSGASMPTLNFNYTILTADSVVGTFDNDNIIIDGNLITRIVYEPTQVRILTRCIADTNLDGAVTAADFSAWVSAFNAGSDIADQNFDGNVSPADFSAWVANFNQGCP